MGMQGRQGQVWGGELELDSWYLLKPLWCLLAALPAGLSWAQRFALPTCYQRRTRYNTLR